MKRGGFSEILILLIVLAAAGIGFWWFKNQGVQEVARKSGEVVGGKQANSKVINKPQFETVEEASQYLADPDIIFVLTYKNETKTYPQRILNWHGTVNDEIGNIPIVITFSPLSGASSASERTVDGNLHQLPLDAMLWSDFKTMFPASRVLSRNTGFDVDYNTLPQFPPVEDTTVVWGIELNGKFKAYPEETLKEKGYIKDSVGGVPVDTYYFKGDIFVRNLKTKKEIVATRIFEFAWKELHPESELY